MKTSGRLMSEKLWLEPQTTRYPRAASHVQRRYTSLLAHPTPLMRASHWPDSFISREQYTVTVVSMMGLGHPDWFMLVLATGAQKWVSQHHKIYRHVEPATVCGPFEARRELACEHASSRSNLQKKKHFSPHVSLGHASATCI